MSRFLFTVWPLTGHIHPNLAVAGQLRNSGHEIAFYTGSKFQSTVERAGLRHFPLRKVDEQAIEDLFLGPQGIQSAGGNPWRLKAKWRECVLDSVPAQVEDIAAILAEWSPDAIVCDPTLWAPFLILHETRHIPVAVFSLIPACHLSGPQGPIIGFPMPRPRTDWERLRASLLRAVSRQFLGGIRRRADEIREGFGLPALKSSVTDHAGRMPLYLVPGSREFDYQRTDLPESVHYVGPCLLKEANDEQLPAWISALPPREPLIYASEGTVHLEPRVLRAVAQGLTGLPVQVIMTTGKHRNPETLDLGLRPLPPNMHLKQWVPLNPLLPKLSLMITVGGPSTMLAAIEEEIPVIVVPFAWDHPETGWRLQESGAGIHIRPKECTPENMRRAVQTILTNPSFKDKTRSLAETFRRCGGAPEAARRIAALVR